MLGLDGPRTQGGASDGEERVRYAIGLAMVALAGACGDSVDTGPRPPEAATRDTGTSTTTEPETRIASASLALDAETTTAGRPVGFVITVISEAGDPLEPESVTVTTDLEPTVASDATSLTPVVAGLHTVTATVRVLGDLEANASATLTVEPGPLEEIDLALASATTEAGVPVPFVLTAEDAFGNDVDTSAVVVTADPEVTLGAAEASATAVGTWTISATDGGVTDEETLEVVAAPAASLALQVPELVLGSPVTATVDITDAFGNPRADPWTLTAAGPSFLVSGDQITAQEEGRFTVTATVDGTGVASSVERLVDVTPPVIDWTSPGDATWQTSPVLVEGTVTDAVSAPSVRVDSADVPLANDAFSVSASLDSGLSRIEVSAVDESGNDTTESRAVMVGPFVGPTESVPDAVLVRIVGGPTGLSAIVAQVAESSPPRVAPDDALVVAGEIEQCLGPICVVVASAEVLADPASSDPPTTTSTLRSSGVIELALTATNLVVPLDASGEAQLLGSYAESFEWTADSVTLTLPVTPAPGPTRFALVPGTESVAFGATATTSSQEFQDNLSLLGLDLDAAMKQRTADALLDSANRLVADLEDRLAELHEGRDGPATLTPASANVSTDQLSLSYDATLSTLVPSVGDLGLGVSQRPSGWTIPSGGDFVLVAFTPNALNQAAYAAWAEGATELSRADPSELGLEPTVFDALLVVPTSLEIDARSGLPPFIDPERFALDVLPIEWEALEIELIVDGQTAFVAQSSGSDLLSATVADAQVELAGSAAMSIEIVQRDPGLVDQGAAEAISREILSALVDRWAARASAPLGLKKMTGVSFEPRALELLQFEGMILAGVLERP